MDIAKLVARAKGIVSNPEAEWPAMAAEPATVGSLYAGYIAPLAAIGPVANFVGTFLFGVHTPLGTIRYGLFTLLRHLAFAYGAALVAVYVAALLIDAFAPRYGGQKGFVQALKTAAYSTTPVWLVGALDVLPYVGPLVWLLSLVALIFAFRLLRAGLPHTMQSPAQQSGTYAGVVVGVAVLAWLIVGATLGGVAAIGQMAKKTAPSTSTLADDDVRVDPASPLGKRDAIGKSLDRANKNLEQAQRSGDADAQQKAMGQLLGAMLGGGDQVQSLEPEKLKSFLPEKLAGRDRASFSAERNAMMGLQVSEAHATYGSGESALALDVTDTGSAKGFTALMGWASLEQERQTDGGYEKTSKRDGRMVHEQWDGNERRGEYSVVVADRFVVKVSGKAEAVDDLRSAAESVDLKGLDALKNEGVQKGG